MDWLRQIPVGQYVAGSAGWLRYLDPRLKFGWVLMFLLTPVLANAFWRLGLVAALLLITFLSGLPLRVWIRSLILLLVLAFTVGLLTIFLPTGETSATLPLRSPNEISAVLVNAKTWELYRIGPFSIDRRSGELGLKTATLIFTLVQSVNLMLITTPAEDLVWVMSWLLSPFSWLGLPVDRLSFQLLLSLRFLPLVQEEMQNLIRALASRAVNLKVLGLKGSINLMLSIAERLLANIFLRAEQGADAFLVRGGICLPPEHLRPRTLANSSTTIWMNCGAGCLLILVLTIRRHYGAL